MKQTLFPLSLLVALLFVGIGCDRRPFKDDPAFDDKVLILENNPELLLVRMTKDSLADRPITDEASATDFLVRTLAQVYTVYGTVPDRERLEQCLAIFRSARKAQQQLETLYLLATSTGGCGSVAPCRACGADVAVPTGEAPPCIAPTKRR